jgi:hypothetical protein
MYFFRSLISLTYRSSLSQANGKVDVLGVDMNQKECVALLSGLFHLPCRHNQRFITEFPNQDN